MSAILTGPSVSPAAHPHSNPFWKRQVIVLSRWLHIYLSMASFGILFFFAVTGLTLNHEDWFNKQQHTVQFRGAMDRKYLPMKREKWMWSSICATLTAFTER